MYYWKCRSKVFSAISFTIIIFLIKNDIAKELTFWYKLNPVILKGQDAWYYAPNQAKQKLGHNRQVESPCPTSVSLLALVEEDWLAPANSLVKEHAKTLLPARLALTLSSQLDSSSPYWTNSLVPSFTHALTRERLPHSNICLCSTCCCQVSFYYWLNKL